MRTRLSIFAAAAFAALVAVIATGCGGSKLSEETQSDWKSKVAVIWLCATGDYKIVPGGYRCKGGSEDALTLIGWLDGYHLGDSDRSELLKYAANELEGSCDECVSILDRELENV